MGHVCPRGMKCTFLKQGKCKYTRRKSVHLWSQRGFLSDAGDVHNSGNAHPEPEFAATLWKTENAQPKRRRYFRVSAIGIWVQPMNTLRKWVLATRTKVNDPPFSLLRGFLFSAQLDPMSTYIKSCDRLQSRMLYLPIHIYVSAALLDYTSEDCDATHFR